MNWRCDLGWQLYEPFSEFAYVVLGGKITEIIHSRAVFYSLSVLFLVSITMRHWLLQGNAPLGLGCLYRFESQHSELFHSLSIMSL